MATRLHYIDWLRVLAVLLLFPYHASRVFAGGDFYVKAVEQSVALSYVLWFIDRWHMPLLFLLAGASTFFALAKRSWGVYLGERVKRLLLPFAFGFLILIPPQTWLGARFNSGYSKSFVTYLLSGDFLVFNIRDGGDYYGGFGIGHLWFLLWLFAVSAVALPLLVWGRSRRGAAWFARQAQRLTAPAWWLAAAFVIFVGEALPDPVGKNPFYFLAFFVLGYVVVSDGSFASGAERFRWWALAGGAILSAAWIATGALRDSLPDPSLGRVGMSLLGGLGAWMVIVAAFGFGRRYLDRPSKALAYLAPASYPLYLIHQTMIVLAAWFVVRLATPWPIQWAVLLVVSVGVTFAVYEAVRRAPGIRVAFGIK